MTQPTLPTPTISTQALHSALEAVASFVASFEPELYSGVEAALLAKVFARVERLSSVGGTLAAAQCQRTRTAGED
jgi:hypothetical protein